MPQPITGWISGDDGTALVALTAFTVTSRPGIAADEWLDGRYIPRLPDVHGSFRGMTLDWPWTNPAARVIVTVLVGLWWGSGAVFVTQARVKRRVIDGTFVAAGAWKSSTAKQRTTCRRA